MFSRQRYQLEQMSKDTKQQEYCPPLPNFTAQFSSVAQSCAEYWSYSFIISPFDEYSGSISFRIDWFDLLAVQGPLKSLLQYHNSKASFLQCSAFIMAQLSHPYVTTGKTIALTIWTFISIVMSLLFNMLCLAAAGMPQSVLVTHGHIQSVKPYQLRAPVLN